MIAWDYFPGGDHAADIGCGRTIAHLRIWEPSGTEPYWAIVSCRINGTECFYASKDIYGSLDEAKAEAVKLLTDFLDGVAKLSEEIKR